MINPTLMEYGEDFYEENDVPEGLSPYAVRTSWMETAIDAKDNKYSLLELLHTADVSIILCQVTGDC